MSTLNDKPAPPEVPALIERVQQCVPTYLKQDLEELRIELMNQKMPLHIPRHHAQAAIIAKAQSYIANLEASLDSSAARISELSESSPPAPAGDDAVRGLVERLQHALDHGREHTITSGPAILKRWVEVENVIVRDAIAALQRLSRVAAELGYDEGDIDRPSAQSQIAQLETDLARTREELANEKGQWELEANNAGRLATALAAKEAECDDVWTANGKYCESLRLLRLELTAARAATDRLRQALELEKLYAGYCEEQMDSFGLGTASDKFEAAKRALAEGEA